MYSCTYLGQGAFAKVFKGVNRETGEVYAIKITDFHEERSQGIPSQLLREISALTELGMMNHPNLVKLESVVPAIDKIYFFMEYCQGDLHSLIKSWRNHENTLNPLG